MKLNCPNCGEPIPADQINIQQMAAVCPNCDTVFSFQPPSEKSKRRKIKQPAHLTLHDGEPLEMAFRTNWRFETDQTTTTAGFLAVFFTIFSLVMFNLGLDGDLPLIIPMLFGVVGLSSMYRLATRLYNKTHIVMDEATINVNRQPLPALASQAQAINLADVTAIHCDETEASIREQYDTPRYRVWAETSGGTRRVIVDNLVEDYAFFVAQQLQQRLELDTEHDISHLTTEQHEHVEIIEEAGFAERESKF